MTFLNPLVLLALAAASIPLLLHLLNLRKLRTVDFSSLRFLKELQKTRIRRLKLKQILLLLLRIGLVVFAVLAFARPALRGTAGLSGSHAATTAVILVDNSASMSIRDERGPRLQQARRAALDVADLLEENDEAIVVPMTDPRGAAEAHPLRSREAVRAAIEGITLSNRRADLDDALRVAASLLDRSTNLNKEVYLVTDMQRTNLRPHADSVKIFTEASRIYLMPIGAGSRVAGTNLGLDSIRLLTSLFEADKPAELRAWVRNYGDKDVANATVSMYVAGERLAQSTVTVPAGGGDAVELSAAPKRGGLVGGWVEISGDDFDQDNRRYFAFPVVDRMRVALVGTPENLRYLDLLLGLSPSAITAERFPAGSLGAIDLGKFSSVVLVDPAGLSGGDGAKLARYVEDGGGVVIYGGPAAAGAGLSAGLSQLGMALGAQIGNDAGYGFASVEKEHPIFAGVFDPGAPGNLVESPKLTAALPAAGGETIIRLSGGAPFMSEFRRGRGRVIFIAAPPTQTWGDFPTRGIFVPIAVRSALYVGATGGGFVTATVGESVTVPIPARGVIPEQVKVTAPDGRDRFVPLRRFPSGASIVYDGTTLPGVYRVSANGQDLALFTVNLGSGESDLRPMTEEELRAGVAGKMITPDNLKVLAASSGDFSRAITDSRYGLELWKYALLLALLCAFAEMIIGRAPKEVAA